MTTRKGRYLIDEMPLIREETYFSDQGLRSLRAGSEWVRRKKAYCRGVASEANVTLPLVFFDRQAGIQYISSDSLCLGSNSMYSAPFYNFSSLFVYHCQ
jgi:hypothetical protein